MKFGVLDIKISKSIMDQLITVFLEKTKIWKEEMQYLRSIFLDCQLNEELKWGKPCYTYQNNNILILYGLKNFCGPGFFKGVLLKDAQGILSKPGENSQAVRYIKFTNVQQIIEMEADLRAYIYEAIEVEKAGLKVDYKEKNQLVFPEEFLNKLAQMPALKTAFETLSPGRQRAYNLHFSAAKQSKTRLIRVENHIPRILKGLGINDCICGHTKRKPYCDGSHKYFSKEN